MFKNLASNLANNLAEVSTGISAYANSWWNSSSEKKPISEFKEALVKYLKEDDSEGLSKFISENNIDINSPFDSGETLFAVAMKGNKYSIAKALLTSGEVKDLSTFTTREWSVLGTDEKSLIQAFVRTYPGEAVDMLTECPTNLALTTELVNRLKPVVKKMDENSLSKLASFREEVKNSSYKSKPKLNELWKECENSKINLDSYVKTEEPAIESLLGEGESVLVGESEMSGGGGGGNSDDVEA